MNPVNKSHLQQILGEYDPDYDIPDGSRVPWYAAWLANIILEQQREIEKLTTLIDNLYTNGG